MELIIGNTRVLAAELELIEGGMVAKLSGDALKSVLNATFGGQASVEVWGEGLGARPMSVAEIEMHGASSTVTLMQSGSAYGLH